IKKKQVIVELTHEYHAEYANVHVMDELKEYIQNNLHQTSRVIWENLGIKSPNITEKQMYY
ncbi:11576_t:CDS:1, partial [Gigaspora rosea]